MDFLTITYEMGKLECAPEIKTSSADNILKVINEAELLSRNKYIVEVYMCARVLKFLKGRRME